ncbi:MAG: ABC transporter permease [Siphonobacter aquaeclarae]|nr:ABC transporter permease [Siphonobacter aquaeclarae]
MFRNYLKIAFRQLLRQKMYSFINIAGLASGMAVALLIGLWIVDELTFDSVHAHRDRLGQVWQFVNFTGEKASYGVTPQPLAEELRSQYPEFQSVSLSKGSEFILADGDRKFRESGNFVETPFPDMVSLQMLSGTKDALKDPRSILLSKSVATEIFGEASPLNQVLKLDNKEAVRVAGVYADFPMSSSFHDVRMLAPWNLLVATQRWVRDSQQEWDNNSFQVYVQLREGADFETVSAKIRDTRMKKKDPPAYKPEFFVHPMRKWHLYSDFENGVNVGGLIEFVRLFGLIGLFILLLACINFMNLSTARSEKRAREVGIRKAIGSARSKLIAQFFSESLLVVVLSFTLSLIVAELLMPFFNNVAGKQLTMPWGEPLFWLCSLVFCGLTGFIAGSYPAFYLSSFQPVKVLKGTFRAGRFAAVPRQALVVFQFAVSITLLIGTLVVFKQIQYAKDRPVGYSKEGLLEINALLPEVFSHYDALRDELLHTGAIRDVSASRGSLTLQDGGTTDVSWKGKSADGKPLLMGNYISHDFGRTIGWEVLRGRDFSRRMATDSAGLIINEAAAKLMGFRNPVGETVRWNGQVFQVIGVVRNMVKENPFAPVNPSGFMLNYKAVTVMHVRLAPDKAVREALAKVEPVFRKYNPESPFSYRFVDEEYGRKFAVEERVGKLAGFFAVLTVLISSLGLFGLASFVAEQRVKEIGVRKVLGASVAQLWGLLSKDFVRLVLISCLISIPFTAYLMDQWLARYSYRTTLSWWMFGAAGLSAIGIALGTVSYQTIRAALVNPVKSLKSE